MPIEPIDRRTFNQIHDLMEGRKLAGMIMMELDSGGQMPYTPREAVRIARDFLVKSVSCDPVTS